MKKTKRFFDVSLALLLGVLLLPVILLVIGVVKVTSPGPVLFRQQRVGKGGQIFYINKFRKFPANWGTRGPGVTLEGDSRMTNVGQFLERTKLDEVPQLWNILIGEMSFVGPRPESLVFSHLYQGEYEAVLDYTPGLFGPNQTRFRNESTMYPAGEDPVEFYERELFPQKARADIEYFKDSTFWSDLRWMVQGGCALVFNLVTCKRTLMPTLALIVWDLVAFTSAWALAHWLKYSIVRPIGYTEKVFDTIVAGVLIVPVAALMVFAIARAYRNPVRYFSETDAFRLIGATCFTWIIAAVTFGVTRNSTSSFVLAVAALISVFLVLLPRTGYAQFHTSRQRRRFAAAPGRAVNTLICGVSPQSLQISSLLKYGFEKANVIGLIATQKAMVRREIKGFPVLGTFTDLDVVHARYNIDQIWYGTNLTNEQKNMVKSWCLGNQVDSVSIAGQPGFRKLVVPEYGVASQAGLPADSDREKAEEVAA